MKRGFYPIVLATDPPRVVTKEDVDNYFKNRGTVVKILHVPATCPRQEEGWYGANRESEVKGKNAHKNRNHNSNRRRKR